jgi:hypothetical protein
MELPAIIHAGMFWSPRHQLNHVSMKKKLKIILLILLLAFIVSEVYFRLTFPEQLKDQTSPLIYEPDPITTYRFIPNSEGVISKPGIGRKKVKINSLGYFTPEFSEKKKPGTYRIVIVGTSTGSGIWMDGTSNFAMRLQEKFNKDKKNVEIVNCSLDGQGLGYGLLKLIESKVVNYEPDLVLLEFVMPVTTGAMQRESYKGYMLQYYTDSSKALAKQAIDDLEDKWLFRFAYDYSYTYRAWCRDYVFDNTDRKATLIRTYKDRISRIEEIDVNTFKFKKSLSLLKATSDSVARKGGIMVLYSYDKDNGTLTPYFKDSSLNVVYLNCQFKPEHVSRPDTHLNEHGHAIVADSLYNVLIKKNFFRDSTHALSSH